MEIIKKSLMQWGEAMQLTMENRSLFYSPVLKHWRVKKWTGKDARSCIYEGGNFEEAFEIFMGHHGVGPFGSSEENAKLTGADEEIEAEPEAEVKAKTEA